MLTMLESIATLIHELGEDISNAVLYAFEVVINLVLAGIGEGANDVFKVLPSMPELPKIPLEYLEYANWWYPFGPVATFIATVVTMYLVWMGYRYIMKVVKAT